MGHPFDTMTFIPTDDYRIRVWRGKVPGVSARNKFGRNLTVSATSEEDIWHTGGRIHWPTAAQKVSFVSDSTNDVMTTGTGLWEISLKGLDSSYNEITETVELNGATPVQSALDYLRLPRIFGLRTGSGNENDGNITGTWVTDATTCITLEPGAGQGEHLAFTVPVGVDAVPLGLMAGLTDDTTVGTRAAEMRVYARIYDATATDNYQAWRRVNTIFLFQDGTTMFDHIVQSGGFWPEKTDVRFSIYAVKADTNIFGRLEYFLYDN